MKLFTFFFCLSVSPTLAIQMEAEVSYQVDLKKKDKSLHVPNISSDSVFKSFVKLVI